MSVFDIVEDIRIDNVWLKKDLGFIVSNVTIGIPKPIFNYLEITGGKSIDLTESMTGSVEFKTRPLSFDAEFLGEQSDYFNRMSTLLGLLHGQKKKISFDVDETFYWEGRLEVDDLDCIFYGQSLKVSADVDPYKYELFTSNVYNDWVAIQEEFPDIIVRDYFEISVETTRTVTIVGRTKKVSPMITSSTAMTVTYLGVVFNIYEGENNLYDIFIGQGEHELIFTGTGVVSILYRGADL